MKGRWDVRRRRLALWVGLTLVASSSAASAQSDSSEVARATLRQWNERHKLTIFARSGSLFGRLSDEGILQRFADQVDDEYDLDFISSSFSLTEVYRWYHQDNGARFWTGSINSVQLVQEADLVASIWFGESWGGQVRFFHQRTQQARRSLPQVEVRRKLFGGRAQAYLYSTLNDEKPDIDMELGFVWFAGAGELTFAVAALDLFNDFIFQTLEPVALTADTLLDYTKHPFTGRVALDVRLGRQFRAEAYALGMSPTRLVVEVRPNPDSGFVQDERYAYAGGMIEWGPSQQTGLGLFATWVRARLDRSPLPDGRPEDNFDLTEKTAQVGVYGIHRFARRFETEAWLARVWRTEERVTPDPSAAANLDYEDRAWAGRGSLIYRACRGFRGELSLDLLAREAVGPSTQPGSRFVDRDNFRLRVDVGWHFSQRAFLVIGANLDLDGDLSGESFFDGAHGRFALYW